MLTEGAWQFPKWVANLIGVLLGLLALGLIAYFIGVNTHLLQRPATGFWTL